MALAIETCVALGATALTDITNGGMDERSGLPPTDTELDKVDRAFTHMRCGHSGGGLPIRATPLDTPCSRYRT
ncbi:hypothetical protein So717_26480 [Roseobacter cerasinus]|uniref:Uncharacterized protein n=1 Tax=Roseobacter cerasinus TaxID=2602289 RepID=A0A640VVH2_9RHOB|nr:hypothetical protein So717_26480 [Roseobacter cerasinus]